MIEHNALGPALVFAACSLATCLLFWRAHVTYGWFKGSEPFASSFEAFFVSFVMVILVGLIGYTISDKLIFNNDYYNITKKEAQERRANLEKDGYELWSIIDSRPIQNILVSSCDRSPLVTDKNYRKIDINSEEVRDSLKHLYVFCMSPDAVEK